MSETSLKDRIARRLRDAGATVKARAAERIKRAASPAVARGFNIVVGELRSIDGTVLEGDDAMFAASIVRDALRSSGYVAVCQRDARGVVISVERGSLIARSTLQAPMPGRRLFNPSKALLLLLFFGMVFVTRTDSWQHGVAPCLDAGGGVGKVWACIRGEK